MASWPSATSRTARSVAARPNRGPCLKQKGVKRLPSIRNKKLARHVRQEINRAVNARYREHPDAQFAYEQLYVASMRFKAWRMSAYLSASHVAHLPAQLAWGAAKQGVRARRVKSAILLRNATAVIMCPARVAQTSRRSVVGCVGTRTMPTSMRQRIWPVVSSIKS
jgi:hypothetical protein